MDMGSRPITVQDLAGGRFRAIYRAMTQSTDTSTAPAAAPVPDPSGAEEQQRVVLNGDPKSTAPQKKGEIGGPKGPEPTRFGDWETGGRCSDF